MSFRTAEGEKFDMSVEDWRAFAGKASFYAAREKARSLGIHIIWDCELTKTPEGYYQAEKGIEFAIPQLNIKLRRGRSDTASSGAEPEPDTPGPYRSSG